MFQIQLINTVVEWERRLEILEEKRKNLKGEQMSPLKKLSATENKEFTESISNEKAFLCVLGELCG